MPKPVTLFRLLQYLTGENIVIELKDESAVEGRLLGCDTNSLNIELGDATYYRRRLKNLQPLRAETFFVRGKHVRFVHFNDYAKVQNALKRSLKKL